jgi:ABC-type spermidine/putrescine transport system permease subunit I
MTPDPTTQPLYIPPEERVSLDEIKQRAGTIQNLAVVQAKEVVDEVYTQNVTRAALVAVGVVVVAASIAYYIGRQAARQVVKVDID